MLPYLPWIAHEHMNVLLYKPHDQQDSEVWDVCKYLKLSRHELGVN